MKRLVTALKITELYDLSHTAAGDYLAGFTYPWQALEGLKDFILALGPKLPKEEYEELTGLLKDSSSLSLKERKNQ